VLAWLACTFLWFGATVLRGRRDRFLFGAVLGAYAGLLALNLLGPDALVAKVNLDRYATTGTFDAPYATRLGAEAVPRLLDGLGTLPAVDRDVLARNLLLRYDTRAAERGWRSWNYALGRAERLVQERKEELRLCLLPQKNGQQGR
jgi:hypothetical protein